MKRQDVFIVEAIRTPVAKAKGDFRTVRPDDLLAFILKGLLQKVPDIDPAEIEDVIIGCAMPEAEQGMNIARIACLLADLPNSVPAQTINRFCSSGLQSIATAAQSIALGEAQAIIAGGVESMSRVPMGGFKFSGNPHFFDHTKGHKAIAYSMGITAEHVAKGWKISREAQDEYALESHKRAVKAIEQGAFKQEILPYMVVEDLPDLSLKEIHRHVKEVRIDQGPRANTSLEALMKLKPVFSRTGTVTAGNSSQMSDGAGAVLVASEAFVKRYNLKPLARFMGFKVAGVPPEIMGIGPIEAIPKVLKHCDLSLQQIDWIELNEAFAAQTLAVIQSLELDQNKVNPLGGAIALGHPLGATGTIRTATLLHGLKRKNLKYGLVTMCIGTGMGAAGLFEAL